MSLHEIENIIGEKLCGLHTNIKNAGILIKHILFLIVGLKMTFEPKRGKIVTSSKTRHKDYLDYDFIIR